MAASPPPGTKVLLGEDSRVSSTLLRAQLLKHGYTVVGIGETGLETAALFKEHRPDLVLLDINMPKGNGLTILRLIREIDSEAKVIMLTGDATRETVLKAKGLGASAYISKISDFPDVLTIIHKVIHGLSQEV